MQKRRVFKRKKPPQPKADRPLAETKRKSISVKKPAEKKVPAVKHEKPVEPVHKYVPHKHLNELKPDKTTETVATETPPETPVNEASDQNSDIIVVEETTVAEVVRDNESSRKLSFIWTFLGIFLIFFISGGVIFSFLFQQPQKPEEVYTAPTNTPQPTASSAAAPKPAEWKVAVLNGSGVPGAAATMAEKLKTLGYSVTNTGNADASQDTTTFYLSKEFLPYAEQFAADLKKQEITAKNGGELSDSSLSAQIIIGTE